MSAGQFLDRVINAALIKAADAADRLMATTLPLRDGAPIAMSDLLTEFEETYEVLEPQSCDISGHPLAVEDIAPPADVGVSPDIRADIGGHPDRATSDLLEDAADRICRVATRIWGGESPLTGFINELRDRAASFAAFGD